MNKNILKHLWKRFKDLTLSSDSEEYQRMLAGTRIYFSLMSQRNMNYLLAVCIITFSTSILFLMQDIITNHASQFIGFILIASFTMILMSVLVLLGNWREHGFSIGRGIKIFLRRRFVLFVLAVVILIYILLFIFVPGTFILHNIFVLLGNIFVLLAVSLFMELVIALESTSLIKYAKEQVNKIISYNGSKDKEKIMFSRYQLYYFTIYCYYSMEKREIKNYYTRNDVLLLLKFDKFPILASQIIYNDNKKRKILVDILSDLEEIKPIIDAKKFLEIMDKIDNEFGKSLFSEEKDIDLKNIFQKQSLYKRTRGYLLPLIPIATILINVFLGRL